MDNTPMKSGEVLLYSDGSGKELSVRFFKTRISG